jgi:hypothetical protein
MAHFAQLDENNVVIQVIVINNEDTMDANGVEREEVGVAYCQSLFGGNWKQTSYNGNMRMNYAGIGYTYNVDIDAFVPPKPFPSWFLNTDTALWEPPVSYPNDGKLYLWDEESKSWVVRE